MHLQKIFRPFLSAQSTCRRHFCSGDECELPLKLCYSEHGVPSEVVKLDKDEIEGIKNCEVLVRMLAAPVNPADINTIEGKYPIKPKLPAVPGIEGVGKITQLGCAVKDFSVDDYVVFLTNNVGTWRTHVIVPSDQLLKVPEDLGTAEAATLMVNACTMYRIMHDFTKLVSGDVIIQNGANSACGQYAIQLAKALDFCTVNIVRNRPNICEVREYLKKLGATEVLTEEELKKTDIFKSKLMPKPKLAINCVGGESGMELMRHLNDNAPFITYGGMAKKPLMANTGSLIFKNIKMRGFWISQWAKKLANKADREAMLIQLVDLMCAGKLRAPQHELVPLKDFEKALCNTLSEKGMAGKKFILKM